MASGICFLKGHDPVHISYQTVLVKNRTHQYNSHEVNRAFSAQFASQLSLSYYKYPTKHSWLFASESLEKTDNTITILSAFRPRWAKVPKQKRAYFFCWNFQPECVSNLNTKKSPTFHDQPISNDYVCTIFPAFCQYRRCTFSSYVLQAGYRLNMLISSM